MQLREMIEIAAKKVGDQKTLELKLGLAAGYLTPAKAGKRGLPTIACGKLAEILEIDRWTVIAASELVTERNEEKRAYFSPFVLNGVAGLIAVTALLSTAPTDAHASDTFEVSRPALDATDRANLSAHQSVLCQIMYANGLSE